MREPTNKACQIQACDIQNCLKANSFQSKKCSKQIKALHSCCQKNPQSINCSDNINSSEPGDVGETTLAGKDERLQMKIN